MKHGLKRTSAVAVCAGLTFCFALFAKGSLAKPGLLFQEQRSQPAQTAGQIQTVKSFEKRVKRYVRLREQLEGKLPTLSKDAKSEEIEAHKKAFEDSVRKARANAKRGDILSADIAGYIRSTIRNEFKGADRKDVRKTILESDTKGVSLRVNYPYPEAKELTETPPTLLLTLPQLPKQVKYRFVGKHMLLVDRENGLIIDYITNALP